MQADEKFTTTAVVLAAGLGTRMKSDLAKVLHPVAGRPMIGHVLATLNAATVEQAVVVVGDGMDGLAAAVAPHPTAVQVDRLGTAHAVLAARDFIKAHPADDLLVVFGDTPLITPETLGAMLAARRSPARPGVVVLGFEPTDPTPYGRLIRDGDGALASIVEAKDATPDQLAVTLCNSGVMVIDGARALGWLERIGNANAKGEYYLTDIVAIARADGAAAAVVIGDADEVMGVNSRADLAEAEAVAQRRLRARAMAGGATLIDPQTVYLSWDTALGRDVVIGPNVFFGPNVSIADNVEIRAFCYIEGAKVGTGAVIGPFARLRPGADLGTGVHIGNFVEIKAATLGAGSKANHLSYVGDSTVGAGVNIGAGTITCNYDGHVKSQTVIGDGAFIGSNTALVAPVTVGAGAIVGAGSAISKNVAAGALAVTRAEQKEVKGWADRFNAKGRKAKQDAKKEG
ncbi:bifunctional UDP-N-acetylglucosamine diphosphorylase/glucosamine-1-phosphate N-acetyltransferase GlmU [Thalassospiraceae bacterium LMO-SO8]|nr:bifunctional UDP-N-acetylglucosamine diphosphorylase/glucosamine-1-phosphate N-acetyltransferase GlmU [Alphaproteobacteria bacterium LMO-S08]WND77242.1 bifunctional UDP-N-acetylglucosamine diphosphorylase/glucosamine-1-phosphate N-acetyltransferase GlmU [Thalassospiraceae bacterium LMO-SO8]